MEFLQKHKLPRFQAVYGNGKRLGKYFRHWEKLFSKKHYIEVKNFISKDEIY
jgi:hypothetical protein